MCDTITRQTKKLNANQSDSFLTLITHCNDWLRDAEITLKISDSFTKKTVIMLSVESGVLVSRCVESVQVLVREEKKETNIYNISTT